MALLTLGIVWTIFGIIGYRGFQGMEIPKNFENQVWTKEYKRLYSYGYFILGIPNLLLFVCISIFDFHIDIWLSDLLILLASIPALLYGKWLEVTFTKKVESDKNKS